MNIETRLERLEQKSDATRKGAFLIFTDKAHMERVCKNDETMAEAVKQKNALIILTGVPRF